MSGSATLFIGAVIGFMSAGGLRWWQYRRDLWLGRLKDLVDTIVAYSNASAKYWGSSYDDDPKGLSQKAIDEATIIGLQTCIDGLLASVALRLDEVDARSAQSRFNALSVLAAGDDFGVATKARDAEKARHVLIAGYALKVDITMYADKALTWGGFRRFVFQRARRRQDEAHSGRRPIE